MTSAKDARPHICIVAFSPVARDARVLRQARYLAPHYRVTVAGFGSNPFVQEGDEGIGWHELETGGSRRPRAALVQWFCLRLGLIWPRLYETWFKQLHYWRYAWHFVQSKRFRLIYCNDVDTLPLGIAAQRANKGCKFILDMHEYATREMDEGEEWLKVRKPLVTGIMKKLARRANGTVTVSDAFVEPFRTEFGMKRPVVVYNAPALSLLPPRRPATDGRIHLIHHGGCAPQRQLERMIQAMTHTDDRFVLHLMLVGGEPSYRALLEAEAAKVPAGRVVFDAPVPPERIAAEISQHDIGVYILPDDNFNCRYAMPNKFFDFVSAGLAIAIGPSHCMAEKTWEHGIGWVASDFTPEAFGRMLRELTPAEIAVKHAASLKLRESLNADTEMAKLLALVQKVVDGKQTPDATV